MGRIATRWIITAVAHAHSAWDWTVCQFISYAMSCYRCAFPSYCSVSKARLGFCYPRPALIYASAFNAVPKQGGRIACGIHRDDVMPWNKSASSGRGSASAFTYRALCHAT